MSSLPRRHGVGTMDNTASRAAKDWNEEDPATGTDPTRSMGRIEGSQGTFAGTKAEGKRLPQRDGSRVSMTRSGNELKGWIGFCPSVNRTIRFAAGSAVRVLCISLWVQAVQLGPHEYSAFVVSCFFGSDSNSSLMVI